MLDRVCTWTEVTTTMSIDDVDEMCIADDILTEARNRE